MTHADEILQAKPVLEAAYEQLQKTEAHLTELGDRVNAGIGARTAGEMSAAAKMDTYGARFSKFSIPTLAAIGDFLEGRASGSCPRCSRSRRTSPGPVPGQGVEGIRPRVQPIFSKDVQSSGAQMNAEVGKPLGSTSKNPR